MNGFPTSCIEYYAKQRKCQYQMFINNCMIINLSKLVSLTKALNVFLEMPQSIMLNHYFYGDKETTRTCQFIRDKDDKTIY